MPVRRRSGKCFVLAKRHVGVTSFRRILRTEEVLYVCMYILSCSRKRLEDRHPPSAGARNGIFPASLLGLV
jgi:hypothetical protein